MTIDRILRLPELLEVVGLSPASVYRRVARGSFPRPLRLGPGEQGAVGWKSSEVAAWLDSLDRAGPVPRATEPENDGSQQPGTSSRARS
jgi:prophage regulatory protein